MPSGVPDTFRSRSLRALTPAVAVGAPARLVGVRAGLQSGRPYGFMLIAFVLAGTLAALGGILYTWADQRLGERAGHPPDNRCRRRASWSSRVCSGVFQPGPRRAWMRSRRCTTVFTWTCSSSFARVRLPPLPK